MTSNDDLVSRAVILARVAVPESTLKYWTRRGYIRPIARLPRCNVYSWAAVCAWLYDNNRGDLLRDPPTCERCGDPLQRPAQLCGFCKPQSTPPP